MSMLPSRALFVYQSGNEFFTSARVPLDEYRTVCSRNHLSLAEHLPQFAAFRNNLLFAMSEGSPTGGEPFRRIRTDKRIHTSSLSSNQVSELVYLEVYFLLKSIAELSVLSKASSLK